MQCNKCSETNEEHFYPSCKTKCIKCIKETVNKRRIEKIEEIREYDRNRPNKADRVKQNRDRLERYKKEEPEKYKIFVKQKDEWRKRNKSKSSAHNKIAKALLKGEIKRPLNCERCSNTNIQAHHPDYNKPLEVIWLCPICHSKEHIKEREEM